MVHVYIWSEQLRSLPSTTTNHQWSTRLTRAPKFFNFIVDQNWVFQTKRLEPKPIGEITLRRRSRLPSTTSFNPELPHNLTHQILLDRSLTIDCGWRANSGIITDQTKLLNPQSIPITIHDELKNHLTFFSSYPTSQRASSKISRRTMLSITRNY